MIEGLKPYAEYRDAGLPGCGKVPAKWAIAPLARLARQKVVIGQVDRELLSVYLNRGVIRFAEVDAKRTNATSEDLSLYQAVDPGDLVLNNQQAWRGSVGVSNYSGLVSPAYFVLKLSDCYLPKYADLLFRERSMIAQYVVCSKGVGTIQRNLYWPHLKRIDAIVPPRDEQAAIVRFLDWANGRLERAIRAKRKVIALLNEQKQAIIHRAVTRGLDPSVPLKPSGISWLGDIPQHWDCTPIKRLLSRIDYGTSETSTEGGSIRILTMGNIQGGEVIMPRSGGLNHVPNALLLDHHDLLFTRTNGNPNLVGKVGIFRGRVFDRVSFASYLVRFRTRPEYEAQWLHLLLNSSAFWPFARSQALVNLQTNLNSTRYSQFLIPVPPRSEQIKIANWIVETSKPLNIAAIRLEREIDLLREYRTRLIADIVTGQLDVREAAARLPDEALLEDAPEDDPDLIDEAETPDEEAIS